MIAKFDSPRRYEENLQHLEDSLHVHILSRNESSVTLVTSDSSLLRSKVADNYNGPHCLLVGKIDLSDYSEITSRKTKANKRSVNDMEWFESYVSTTDLRC